MTPALAAAMLDDAATSIQQQAGFFSAQAGQIGAFGVNKHGVGALISRSRARW
jgi:hypothetical protein